MGHNEALFPDVPSGFANALAADPAAFRSFLTLDEDGQQAIIRRAKSVASKAEMKALAHSLHA